MNAFTRTNSKVPGICQRCGFKVRLSELQRQVVAGKPTALRVCGSCLDEDNAQLLIGRLRVSDPQAVRDPSPPREVDVSLPGAILGINFTLGLSVLAAKPYGSQLDGDFWLDGSTTEPETGVSAELDSFILDENALA